MEPTTKLVMKRETVEISNGRKLYNYTFIEEHEPPKVGDIAAQADLESGDDSSK